MAATLHRYDGPLVEATYVDRPNRFTVRVAVDGTQERAYLRNSGGLSTTLAPGRTVLCRPVDDPDRVTDYDALAVDVDGTWATLDATLPNAAFEACVAADLLPAFADHEVVAREPALPDEGRTDFLLSAPGGADRYVEVKSNTYVTEGTSLFPDRPTERGRRHLRSLTALAGEPGTEAAVAFVVQRPDAERVRPFREVDPEFADLLADARAAGVTVTALATAFDPPAVTLAAPELPVETD